VVCLSNALMVSRRACGPGRTEALPALPFVSPTSYADLMNEIPASPSSSRSIGRMIVAGLILVVAAWVLLHFVIGIIAFFATIAVVVLAIAAVVWAVRVLL
jgi:hypothetical protein